MLNFTQQMSKMKTFREWLSVQESNNFYTEEMFNKDIMLFNNIIKIIDSHDYSLNKNLNEETIDYINEKIIEPEKIIINTLDLNKLNSYFNKLRIYFHKDDKLNGAYDFKQDSIYIGISDNDTKQEIEALIGHELVHKTQHKKSGINFFKLTEKMVKELQELINKRNYYLSLPSGSLIYKKELDNINELIKQKDLEYKHLNTFEEMAYAYQSVKTYSNLLDKPHEIIELLLHIKFPVSKRLKKYIAMYWLIKDKI